MGDKIGQVDFARFVVEFTDESGMVRIFRLFSMCWAIRELRAPALSPYQRLVRLPLSTSAFFTHSCSVGAKQPTFSAIDPTVAQRDR